MITMTLSTYIIFNRWRSRAPSKGEIRKMYRKRKAWTNWEDVIQSTRTCKNSDRRICRFCRDTSTRLGCPESCRLCEECLNLKNDMKDHWNDPPRYPGLTLDGLKAQCIDPDVKPANRPVITNFVVHCKIFICVDEDLDLRTIAQSLPNTEYEPRKFKAVKTKLTK
jgi:hypothetical protein